MLEDYRVKSLSFEEFGQIWRQSAGLLDWNCLFVLPFWLQTVCRHLGSAGEPLILAFERSGQPAGVVPLAVEDRCARFLGNPDVCDYQDLIVAPGQASQVLRAMQAYLRSQGIRRLELGTLRPDATLLAALKQAAALDELALEVVQEDVTYETTLPASWDAYLRQLKGKQRHEVRRKIRRLEAHGPFHYGMADNNGLLDKAVERFMQLFQSNREDKAAFMSGAMGEYFGDLIQTLGHHSFLRLYFLEIDTQLAATVLCFDYNGIRYLYNSGYDKQFEALSVGMLCKILSIRSGIEMGCQGYDFLKGAETYKKHIGGWEVPLYRCDVRI